MPAEWLMSKERTNQSSCSCHRPPNLLRKQQSLNPVITRFMRVIQQPRVGGGGRVSFGAMDIAPLDCPDRSGNDGVAGLQPDDSPRL